MIPNMCFIMAKLCITALVLLSTVHVQSDKGAKNHSDLFLDRGQIRKKIQYC